MDPALERHTTSRFLAAILALALAGCSHYAKPLRKSDAPAPETAVVYGRFSLTLQGLIMAPFDSGIGEARLRLKCEDGKGCSSRSRRSLHRRVLQCNRSRWRPAAACSPS